MHATLVGFALQKSDPGCIGSAPTVTVSELMTLPSGSVTVVVVDVVPPGLPAPPLFNVVVTVVLLPVTGSVELLVLLLVVLGVVEGVAGGSVTGGTFGFTGCPVDCVMQMSCPFTAPAAST